MRRLRISITMFALLAMVGIGIKPAIGEETTKKQASRSSVINLQVWKHSTDTSLKIWFDDKLIYEDKFLKAANEVVSDSAPSPKSLGQYAVKIETEHKVVVEAEEVGIRSRLIWRPEKEIQWVVVSYYSRTDQYKTLPTITFSIQDGPSASK